MAGISEDRWLTERVGRDVFTVDAVGALDELGPHMTRQRHAMYQTRVPSDRVDIVRRLCEAGLYVVDLTVTLGRRVEGDGPPAASIDIVEAEDAHEKQLLSLATSAFTFSRFHLDPLVPKGVADRIKRDWVESYLRGRRGVKLLVAVAEGAVAGFLAVLAGEEDNRLLWTIDLVAVAPERRSMGVATALTHAFLADARGCCEEVRVGTQAANVPATRLYERLGFSVVRTAYAMHGHIER